MNRPVVRTKGVWRLAIFGAVGVALFSVLGIVGASAVGASTKSASGSGLAKANAAVAKYELPPTNIGNATPLPKAPPKNKLLIFLTSENPQTHEVSNGVQSAAQALGWKFKVLSWSEADPATLVAAMKQALSYHPYAISFTGVPEAAWSSELPAYVSAGVGIIPCCGGTMPNSPSIWGQVDSPTDALAQGQTLANWFISKSGGKGHLVLANIPDIPSLAEQGAAVQKTVKADCPSCSVTEIQISLTSFATNGGVPAIVAAMQANPDAKYLITEQAGSDQGLPAALSGAGVTGTQINSTGPGPTEFSYIKAGTMATALNGGYGILGWMMADIAAQKSTGVANPNPGIWPIQLLTQSFMKTFSSIPSDINRPQNYQAQYKKKWHVG